MSHIHDQFCLEMTSIWSPARLSSYRLDPDERIEKVFGRYLWNQMLTESLSTGLGSVEVALRNRIHLAACEATGREDWYDANLPDDPSRPLLCPEERKSVEKAKKALHSARHPLTPSGIVATLTFGFWTNMLHRPYEATLWPKGVAAIVPHAPRRLQGRSNFSKRINPLRGLRNRMAHHEPIWNLATLDKHHRDIYEVMSWLSRPLTALMEAHDRFPEIRRIGLPGCEGMVRQVADGYTP